MRSLDAMNRAAWVALSGADVPQGYERRPDGSLRAYGMVINGRRVEPLVRGEEAERTVHPALRRCA